MLPKTLRLILNKFVLIYIFLLIIASACSTNKISETNTQKNQFNDDGPIIVSVSVLPQQYFIDRITDGQVKVNVMVGPGSDPHTYEPKSEQMRALSASKAYFSVGVEFEKAWLDKFQDINPDLIIVDTTLGINLMPQIEESAGDLAAEIPSKTENEIDPHIWTSPTLVKIQAQTICNALIDLDPQNASEYQLNLDEFLGDIDELDQFIRATLKDVHSRSFIVFHPAWGYFARDYDLIQIPIEVGGQEPSAQELANVITLAKGKNIKILFAQPELSTRSANIIATEIGGEVLLVDPLAYDWIANMEYVAETFSQVLE